MTTSSADRTKTGDIIECIRVDFVFCCPAGTRLADFTNLVKRAQSECPFIPAGKLRSDKRWCGLGPGL